MKTKSSEPMHIVVCANEKFALGAWMALWSAAKNYEGNDKPVFHLMTHDGGTPGIVKIQKLAAAHGMKVLIQSADLHAIRNLPFSDRLPAAAYLRLLAPLLLEEIGGFLYLDSDLLVRGNVEELRNAAQGTAVAAVTDYYFETLDRGLPEWSSKAGAGASPYLNSGVMWIDTHAWRREKITEKCLEYLSGEGRQTWHGDQDALNVAFAGSFSQLDPSWNMQVGALDYFDRTGWPKSQKNLYHRRNELLRDAKIAHFLGPAKPWNDGIKTAYASEYRRGILTSGWVRPVESQWWTAMWFIKSMRNAVKRRCAV